MTDTQGHLLFVRVHPANESDTVRGGSVVEDALWRYPSLKGVCGDAGYRGTFVWFVTEILKRCVEIVEKLPGKWRVLPKRWVVERTFAWLNGARRLSKDYEVTQPSAESHIYIAHARLLLRRVALNL